MASKDFADLGERVKAFAINSIVIYVVFVASSGRWIPTGGLESVWFFSAIAMWSLTLLSAPWFVPPRDVLANATAAIFGLVTIDLSGVQKFVLSLEILRWSSSALFLVLATFAVVALFVYNPSTPSTGGRAVYRLASSLGKGEVFYTAPAFISIIGAYQNELGTLLWLLAFWTFFVVVRPVERILETHRLFKLESDSAIDAKSVGMIDRIDYPDLLRVKLTNGALWKQGTLFTASMSNGSQRFVMALFTQVQGLEEVGTGLCIADVQTPIPATLCHVYHTHDDAKAAEFVENLSGVKSAELVGFVVENSSIGALRFEVAAASELSEGDVVFAKTAGHEVFYQILDANTAEESFDQNPRGTHIVQAAQLGCYDEAKGFTKYSWLPMMNTPLFWAKARKFPPPKLSEEDFVIGTVPNTNIGVVAKMTELAEYHTAILGVTGTGKTELALEVVREALKRNIKVFCVDFTGEYRGRLEELEPEFPAIDAKDVSDLETKLFDADTGAYGAGAEKKVLQTFVKGIRANVEKQIAAFMLADDRNLAILELSEIANSKATLHLTEIYLSSIMQWSRRNRKARQAMIVLEEAHTIIPEIFGSGFDYDTQWVVGRIGQIALQGRKYGVGLLVVSQRTALVSKTILSQCNTFLTHSLIDQTSLNFLESVYSHQHAKTIPNLGKFEFLAFGKAIRSERPIQLKKEFDQAKKDASEKLNKPLKGKGGAAEEPIIAMQAEEAQ